MDQKGGLQLLPGTKKRLGIKIPGENRFLYIGSAILGAVLITMFALGRQETSLRAEIEQLDEQIAVLEQKRNKKDEVEIRSIKSRLTLVQDLIDNHTYWTLAFTWLESLLQSSIQIKNITATTTGKLSIAGRATNYTVIAKQIAAFLTDDRVIDLQIGKITSSPEGIVEFALNLEVDFTKILYK